MDRAVALTVTLYYAPRHNIRHLSVMSSSFLTARLPVALRRQLDAYSRARNLSRSDVVKAALDRYLKEETQALDAPALGEAWFGRHASGLGDLAAIYKVRLKRKLAGKHGHQTEPTPP